MDGGVWFTAQAQATPIDSFDPTTEAFQQFAMLQSGSDIRELQGRPGEVWAAESGQDRIVVIRH